ncbi:MAG: sialidase family protein, partial [Acidimicrobiales bacterium]
MKTETSRRRYWWLRSASLAALVSATAVMAFLAAPVAAQAAHAAATGDPALAPPANVAVTDTQPLPYDGPSTAVDPLNHNQLAIAYEDGSGVASMACNLGLSSNDGATWKRVVLEGQGGLMSLPAGNDLCHFPSLTYGPDGTLYYAFDAVATLPAPPNNAYNAGHTTLYLTTSRDGGASFGAPVPVDTQPPLSPAQYGGDYLPSLATDSATGRLYVTWNVYVFNHETPQPSAVAYSTDHGQSFSSPVHLPFPSTFPHPSVGANGRLYVSYTEFKTTPPAVQVVSSTDGGQTFSAPVAALSGSGCGGNPPCSKQLTGSLDDYELTGEATAGSATGVVYAAAQVDVGGVLRIEVSISHDHGANWSSPATVGIPPGGAADSQIFPNLAVAPDGRVDLAYYNLAQPPTPLPVPPPQGTYQRSSLLETTWVTSSTDEGVSWSIPRLVSDAPSSTGIEAAYVDNGSYGGGHLVASTNGATEVAWTDARRGTITTGKTDVYFARLQLAPRGYRMVASDGGIFDFGNSAYHGSTGNITLNQPVVGMA